MTSLGRAIATWAVVASLAFGCGEDPGSPPAGGGGTAGSGGRGGRAGRAGGGGAGAHDAGGAAGESGVAGEAAVGTGGRSGGSSGGAQGGEAGEERSAGGTGAIGANGGGGGKGGSSGGKGGGTGANGGNGPSGGSGGGSGTTGTGGGDATTGGVTSSGGNAGSGGATAGNGAGGAGEAGAGGEAGFAGEAGAGGNAGQTGGTAGGAGTVAIGGAGGSAGSTATGGTAGVGGTGAIGGAGGSAGSTATGGVAGASGGGNASGSGGVEGGSGGTSGNGGLGGAGTGSGGIGATAGGGGISGDGATAGSGGLGGSATGGAGSAGLGGAAGTAGTAGTGGGSVGECFKVAPGGDDSDAVASGGVTPFANVQPAIDFASTHSNLATKVCVAGGASCSDSASYPGPAGTDLTMRDGISVYGSYETTGWTQCPAYYTTALAPATALGVVFGPGVQSAVLDHFIVFRYDGSPTAAITVAGAQGVELSTIEIDSPDNVDEATGVDVYGGAEVAIDGVFLGYESASGTIKATGETTGFRCVDSRVDMTASTFRVLADADQPVYGMSLENCSDSTISGSSFRSTGNTSAVTTAGRIQGGSAIEITDSSFNGGYSDESPTTSWGLDVSGAADVALVNVSVIAECNGNATGLRATASSLTLSGTSTVQVYSHHVGNGIDLDDSQGSIVASVQVAADATSNGVHVHGGGNGLVIGGSVTGGGAVTGILLEDCAGEAPVVSAATVTVSGNTAVPLGIRALGDCHPKIENSFVTLTTTRSNTQPWIRGIRCDAHLGIPSACKLNGNTIQVNYSPGGAGDNRAIGISCSGGSCSQLTGNHITLSQPNPTCNVACFMRGYGAAMDGSPALSNNTLSTSCGGSFSCWDDTALYHTDTCASGYVHDGDLMPASCVDIDECQTNNGGCDPLRTCVNTPGSRTCGSCPVGYANDGGTGCVVDYCYTNNGGCDPLTTCTNSPTGAVCGSCPNGYDGDGSSGCVLAGACPTTCSNGGTCAPVTGGCDCDCPSGITGKCCELTFQSVSAVGATACAIANDDTLHCWGNDDVGQATAPAGTFLDVSTNGSATCAIRTDGTITCFGVVEFGDPNPPSGTFNALSQGSGWHLCAIRDDDTVACWGSNNLGQGTPPSGAFARVRVGYNRSVGVRPGGAVEFWGESGFSNPSGTYLDAGVGQNHACAVRSDGSLVCWGANYAGQATPPPGTTYQSLWVAGDSNCALTTGGAVTCWGDPSFTITTPATGSFESISGGGQVACGIHLDHSVGCWGVSTWGFPDD